MEFDAAKEAGKRMRQIAEETKNEPIKRGKFSASRHYERGYVLAFEDGLRQINGEVEVGVPVLERLINELDVQRDRVTEAADFIERFCSLLEGGNIRHIAAEDPYPPSHEIPPAMERLRVRINRLDHSINELERMIENLKHINLV